MAERNEGGDQAEGRRPSDTEALVGDTAASERLTDKERVQPPEAAERQADGAGDDRARTAGAAQLPTERDAEREAELGHS